MKITDEQKIFLDSEYSCERLSCRKENLELIKGVTNKENEVLVNILKSGAWQKDFFNETAYYLIKDKDGNIAFFFSLQTGCLFDSKDSIDQRNQNIRILQSSIHARQDLDKGLNTDRATNFLKSVGTFGLSVGQLYNILSHEQGTLLNKKKDLSLEQNNSVYHVVNTYPSVELHIFCKNDSYGSIWKEKTKNLNMPNNKRMGEIFFWTFVVETIRKIQENVGCVYFYLFAANHPRKDALGNVIENQSLLGYYEDRLKFRQNKRLATNKPSFDYACVFMTQKINDMYVHQKKFFEEFNMNEEEIANAV